MKMRSYNFCHTNTKNPGNNLGIFCLITGRPKLNGYEENSEACAESNGEYKRENVIDAVLVELFEQCLMLLRQVCME